MCPSIPDRPKISAKAAGSETLYRPEPRSVMGKLCCAAVAGSPLVVADGFTDAAVPSECRRAKASAAQAKGPSAVPSPREFHQAEMALSGEAHPADIAVLAARAAAGLPIVFVEFKIRGTTEPTCGTAAVTADVAAAAGLGDTTADGTFTLTLGGTFMSTLAEGSEAISVERTETGSCAFRRVCTDGYGTDAAGATDDSAPRCCLAADGGGTADRLAVARDRVEVAELPAFAVEVPESAADTEVSAVSLSAWATPVAGA